MQTFFAMVALLEQGLSINNSQWEPITRMFVRDNVLLCQRGDAAPYEHFLNWQEMTSQNWSVAQ